MAVAHVLGLASQIRDIEYGINFNGAVTAGAHIILTPKSVDYNHNPFPALNPTDNLKIP